MRRKGWGIHRLLVLVPRVVTMMGFTIVLGDEYPYKYALSIMSTAWELTEFLIGGVFRYCEYWTHPAEYAAKSNMYWSTWLVSSWGDRCARPCLARKRTVFPDIGGRLRSVLSSLGCLRPAQIQARTQTKHLRSMR